MIEERDMLCAINVEGERWKELDIVPVCGDYCEFCGDCLSCQHEDKCPDSDDGEHGWVVEFETVEQAEAWLKGRAVKDG